MILLRNNEQNGIIFSQVGYAIFKPPIAVLTSPDNLRSPPSIGNHFHPQRAYATIVIEDL